MEVNVVNNTDKLRFEYTLGEDLAYLEYRYYKKSIAFMHTKVPENFKGRGVASALAEYAFKFAREQKKPVMVYCPFVSKYLKKHPDLREQLDKNYHK